MLEAGEGLQEIRDAFAKADLTGEEDLEGVLRWFFRAGEVIETDAVGDDVNFFGGDAHLDKRSLRDGGWDGDGVGGGVDLLFAQNDVGLGERLRQVPAAVLFRDDVFLIALMGGAAIADEDAALRLNFASCSQACAGDSDEGVAGGDSIVGPSIEGEGVPVVQLRGDAGG